MEGSVQNSSHASAHPRHDGYLYKIDLRQTFLGAPSKKKYYFVLSDSPVLYWFKNAEDFNCVGRISLCGAAFTYNPRETGRFEIHANNQIYILEAQTNQNRTEWLRVLQNSRKRYYERDNKRKSLEKELTPEETANEHAVCSSPPSNSTFYLDSDGMLNSGSLEVPPARNSINNLEELIGRVAEETSNADIPAKKIINKARESIRSLSVNTSNTSPCKEKCEYCLEWRNKCYELTDELVAHQGLVNTLKRSVVTAHNQRDALIQFRSESSTVEDKLDQILERESLLASLQLNLSDLRRENESIKEVNRKLESENSTLNTMVDAFRDSVKTKDELILKFCDTDNSSNKEKQSTSDEIDVPEAILVDSGGVNTSAKLVFDEASVDDITELKDLVEGYKSQNEFLNREILELQKIIQSLEDRERRLIRQNFDIEAVYYQLKSRYIMVLNHFRSASHPRRLLEPNLVHELISEISRPYSPMQITRGGSSVPIANTSTPSTNAPGVPTPDSPTAEYDILSAYHNFGSFSISKNDPETDSLGFYLNSPTSRSIPVSMMPLNSNIAGSGEAAICTPNSPTTTAEEVNAATVSNNQDEACSSTLTTPAFVVDCSGVDGGDWLMRMAADSKKRSDDIWANIELGQNKEYIEWLQRWDSFLVNHVLQPLPSPNTQMKTLVRFGIPHAYRGRVWKSIVNFLTNNIQAETGKGYYACLLKKAEKIQDTSSDIALKQIDLDLIRTLPTNKMFEKEDSQKAQMLKNVLYAFRFHNKEVEYCQGLNRLAAIGLLYLQEADAFWFLVSCVEYLQPPDYYTPSLVGAVVDQKVLLDLVQEKIPNLWVHLRQVDVDLTLFTLSWFLTVFVDTLSHKIYINIFDVFLCEGNKVLFRFALALLKICEPKILECSSLAGVHACLNNLSSIVVDYKSLADIAFNQMNPFPAKAIEIKRANYMAHFKSVPRSK